MGWIIYVHPISSKGHQVVLSFLGSLHLPATPFATKHCTCCPLAHEKATPQESWVPWVSINWLNKTVYHSLGPLHNSTHKCTVHLSKKERMNEEYMKVKGKKK